MTYTFKAGETYQTRDGRKARIYATDGVGNHPIHGAMKGRDGWSQMLWSADGKYIYRMQENCDLMPPKRRVWVTICQYDDGGISTHYSYSEAAANKYSDIFKVLGPIDVEDDS